jgi:hypothetical protein
VGTLLNDRERYLFDSIALDLLRLVCVNNCILYKFNAYPSVSGYSPVDCLYGEPVEGLNPEHYKPYQVLAYFQEPSHSTDGTDGGEQKIIDGRIFFARKNLEQLRIPANSMGDLVDAGDIVRLFRQGVFWYFDLRNIERTGWVNDSQVYTHYACDVIQNTDFLPERKILGT